MKNMKRIIWLASLIFSINALQAQTKAAIKLSSKDKAKNAEFAKKEKQKGIVRDSTIIKLNIQDSIRLSLDSIADLQKDSARKANRDSGFKAVDSITNEQNKVMATNANNDFKAAKFQEDIANSGKLSTYQQKQVVIINNKYSEKASVATQNGDLQSKANELAQLNMQRQAEIKAVVGKRKAKIIEQQRKTYTKKMGTNPDLVWIDVAEQKK